MSGAYDQKGGVGRYTRTEDDSASSHSGDKSRRLSLKGMAANVAHKDAWHRRHQGTRSVDGATVVGQGLRREPHCTGARCRHRCCMSYGQVAPDARIRLGRRGPGTVVHECDRAPEPALRSGQPSAVRCADRGHRQPGAGVGHVLAREAVVVDTDTIGVGVQGSETSSADDFSKNLIRARCEGRFGISVLSPLGVVSCDLTA